MYGVNPYGGVSYGGGKESVFGKVFSKIKVLLLTSMSKVNLFSSRSNKITLE